MVVEDIQYNVIYVHNFHVDIMSWELFAVLITAIIPIMIRVAWYGCGCVQACTNIV